MIVSVVSALLLLHQTGLALCSGLDSPCSGDDQCSTQYSRCSQGRCTCLPYYANYNGTHCLQSTLLGFECKVSEQCSQKVANSTCLAGVCRCEPGFLQFRRHTCLSPAKLGDVCYSDTHCRLWETGSHCDFLIPKLFGRCVCSPPLRQSKQGAACLPPVWPARPRPSSTTAHLHPQMTTPYYKRPPAKPTSTSPSPSNTTPAAPAQPLNIIPVHSKVKPQPAHIKAGGAPGRPLRTPPPTVSTSTSTSMATQSGPLYRDPWSASSSLGMPCVTDRQCRAVDPGSRCVSGLCDCAVRNSTGCNARNTGCHPGTFQCRATGQCISSYFVCDGRHDCSDGSDEACGGGGDGRQCPPGSFRCWRGRGGCVPGAARCDGRKDCPHGEDEAGCRDNGTGCPEGTLRCAEGTCLPDFEWCNAHMSCPDGSDEPEAVCQASAPHSTTLHTPCPFRCNNGRCRSTAVLCSGRDGCGDASDEERCTVCRCPTP